MPIEKLSWDLTYSDQFIAKRMFNTFTFLKQGILKLVFYDIHLKTL